MRALNPWLLAAVLASTAGTAKAQPLEKLPSLITVTGEGQANILPDIAILRAGVTTSGKTAREASEANAKVMAAVIAAIRASGIAGQEVQTSRLSLQPVRDPNRNELRTVGFQASNQVTVKMRDLTKIGDMTDRLVSAGANDIGGVDFVLSAPSRALDPAREAAMADARRKAEVYARAANVRLGPAVNITEEGAVLPGPVMMRATAEAAPVTPVLPGEQIQRISVSVSYELLR